MMAVAKRGLAWSVVSTLTVLAEGAATLRLRCDVEWWNTEPDTASATVDGGGGGGGGGDRNWACLRLWCLLWLW